ncbi:hypothetical protein CSKR_113166, partial [Clonorchis sinensis]
FRRSSAAAEVTVPSDKVFIPDFWHPPDTFIENFECDRAKVKACLKLQDPNTDMRCARFRTTPGSAAQGFRA